MRYKVGDKVQVKSATDIPESCPTEHGEVVTFGDMLKWCGQTVTIARVLSGIYLIAEDDGQNSWAEDMFQTKSNISPERRKTAQERFLETSYAECKADMEKWRERAIYAERLLSALAAYTPKAERRLKNKKLTR